VEKDRFQATLDLHKQYGGVVLLKVGACLV